MFLALAERSDMVIENFRPGTLERWGLGYEELSARNPRLVLARVSGFGQVGPYRTRPVMIANAVASDATPSARPKGGAFEAAQAAATPVYDARDIVSDPQFRALGTVHEIEDPELGFSPERIAELRGEGAV